MNKQSLDFLYEGSALVRFCKGKNISVPKEFSVLRKRDIKESLTDQSKHTRYSLKRPKYLYQFFPSNDIGIKIIRVDVLIAPKWSIDKTKAMVEDAFQNVKRIKRAHFYVPVKSQIYNQLIELGGRSRGQELLATTDDGLKYLSQYEYDNDVKVVKLSKKYRDEIADIEYLAHKYSKSSRCENFPRKMFLWFVDHLIENKVEALVAVEDGRAIGFIVPSITKARIGHIMSVSVHPDDQGRGVSKLLYYEAMKYFKKNKIRVYAGVSSTNEVLAFSKKLKRKPIYAYLELVRK
ncbi:acetyltransferase, GNAT family [Bacteriovorax sp. BAL6_X]|uniref:GNAT family N-acetyltransferase n=1 Tax=Bacteriovorax sp. BAL6_X TaxID=1201290 RepID=UPI0003861988|nr:GNAT family N-acetyltransferase [Bacteriovorax sp. BAL6_X]EPZ52109.1 acetyltransferase, GNAT family [Bacteriovorax sp. BAL6_X]